MRLFSAQQFPKGLQIVLIVLAGIVSVVAGTSYLIFGSPYSPLIFAGLILGILSVLVFIRMPILALYTALLVVLLPTGLFPAGIQSDLNRSLTIVALIVWGVYVIVRRRQIVWTTAGLFMLGFLVWGLLTLLWAPNLQAARNDLGGYTLRFVLFLFLIANEVKTRETLDGLMGILAIAGWVFIIAGMGSLLSQGYTIGTRLQILEENENTLGGLFPVVVIGVLWLTMRSTYPRRALWMFLAMAFLLMSFILIAFSGSRGGAISWFITILVLLIWRQTRLWGIVGLLILAAAVILAPFILSTTINRFTDVTGDTLLGGREALWQAAWVLIRDHPWTGVGIGNAPSAMMLYVRMFRSALGHVEVSIHNPILTILAETGLPGVLLYLGVLISALWSSVRQYSRFRKLGVEWLISYWALTASAFLGYFASWFKGGAMEQGHSYFLMLALLLIPSHMNINDSTS